MSCSRRESSTIAPQSLRCSTAGLRWSNRSRSRQKIAQSPDRIDEAWEHVLSRKPTAEERAAAQKFLDVQQKNLGSDAAALQELGRSLST